VHPRLSFRRLLQQRLGDAAFGRTHRQHDAAAEQDRLRAHLRQRQGQATGVRVLDAETARRPTTSPRSIFLCASALGSAFIMMNSVSTRFPNGFGNDSGELAHLSFPPSFITTPKLNLTNHSFNKKKTNITKINKKN
jgi:hypothetical protein